MSAFASDVVLHFRPAPVWSLGDAAVFVSFEDS